MSLFFLSPIAAISGVSAFFIAMMVLALVAGIGVILRTPWPIKGLGIGLIVGAAIITIIVVTGPTKH